MKKKAIKYLAPIAAGVLAFGIYAAIEAIELRPARGEALPAEAPDGGIGRAVVVESYRGGYFAELEIALPEIKIYTPGEGEAPAWYQPGEEMAVEWVAETCQVVAENLQETCNALQSDTVDYNARRDIGCPDWNIETRLNGANGLTAEPWELDLLTRIVSRECCGCSETCWVAVCDAILRRVECGYWGDTLYSVISAVEDSGAWAFTTFPGVYDGSVELYEEIRAVCEYEFYNGAQFPEAAMYFNTGYYPGWAIPCYEIDGVYFSASPWLVGGAR